MYAIIKTGGKQYRVSSGESLEVELLEQEPGSSVVFNQVMLVSDGDKVSVGTPTVAGAKVTAEVVEHGRAKKVHIIKFKRRKHHLKRAGHRQHFTRVKVTGIELA